MPSVTVKEYHPESGALLGNISVLDFGRIPTGSTSRVKVLDLAFSGVTSVSNIKLGIVSSGGLVVNSNPQEIADDGSAANGFFGIESSREFDSVVASAPLSRHFAGVNDDISAGNSNNVNVENRTDTISYYVYLDVEIGSADVTAGNGSYKVFFDYS